MAKKLTNASKDIVGAGFPISGSEDTVWRLWPMIWQQGGEILDKDGKKALFGGAQGVKALQLLADMTLKDKSQYADQTPDSQKMYGLFDSGKMGMVVTGPWQMADIQDHHVSYGIQVMPSFNGSHETISPSRARRLHGLQPLRRAPQGGRDVPLVAARARAGSGLGSRLEQPPAEREDRRAARLQGLPQVPGRALFVKNLANAHHIRPPVSAYTQMSVAVGKAIATALLGRGSPKDALARRPRPPTKRWAT